MTTDTRSSIKTLSNPFAHDAHGRLSISGLLLLGVVAGLLHVHLRYPLNIPGHHGLEWMALLMFGRTLSRHRCAAGFIAIGAASSYLLQTPFMGLAHEFKPALIFLLTGAATDAVFPVLRRYLPLSAAAGLGAGLAFTTKPLVTYALVIGAGLQAGMFAKHPDYLPFVSHFLFGMTGGVLGALGARLTFKTKTPQP